MELKSYKITLLKILNTTNIKESAKINLKYQHAISDYTDSNCIAVGAVKLNLQEEEDLEEKTFSIEMTINGVYSHENEEKKDIREKSSNELLFILRLHLATAMAAVGLDPIIIPIQDMDMKK